MPTGFTTNTVMYISDASFIKFLWDKTTQLGSLGSPAGAMINMSVDYTGRIVKS